MELKFILESILFTSQNPMSPKELRDLLGAAVEFAEENPEVKPFKKASVEAITAALEELQKEHEQAQRSYRLACVAGSWQFVTQPEYAPWVKALVGHKNRPPRLSQPALETLAIIAYRQPLTRAEAEQIRGVNIDGVLQTLLERGLVEQVGRAEGVPGRPMTYGTTPVFLEYFGLRSLDELPAADELRRVPVQRPEALLTVDPGLATAPPDELKKEEAPAQDTASAATPQPESAQPAEVSPTEPAPTPAEGSSPTENADTPVPPSPGTT